MMMVQLLSWLLTWKASVRKIDDFRRRGRELMGESGVMQVRKRAVRNFFGGGGSRTCTNSTNVVITPLSRKRVRTLSTLVE